jgi:hypothetical protein
MIKECISVKQKHFENTNQFSNVWFIPLFVGLGKLARGLGTQADSSLSDSLGILSLLLLIVNPPNTISTSQPHLGQHTFCIFVSY